MYILSWELISAKGLILALYKCNPYLCWLPQQPDNLSCNNASLQSLSTSVAPLQFPVATEIRHNKHNKHLMTGPLGNSEFFFPRISMFPETKSRETLRLEGNKIHCSPRDQLLSDLLYSKTKAKFENRAQIPAITCNSSQQWTVDWVTVNCFPFDVIAFAMLTAHGIWRETVSLLDVMWPWTSQWKDAL